MRSRVLTCIVIGLMLISPLAPSVMGANGEEAEGNVGGANSGYPRFGVGSQYIHPGGGISSRLWLNSRFGVEGNAILWSSTQTGVKGTGSLRLLAKLADGEIADFYLAGGGVYNLGSRNLTAVGTGGISLRVLTDHFRVNLEFGMEGRSLDRFGMSFGSGFHFYF